MSKYAKKIVAFHPEWVEELGDINQALLLQQLHYWSDKGELDDGWIYKSIPDIEYETTLTRGQQDRAIKKLVEAGYILQESRQTKSRRIVRHFLVIKVPVQNEQPTLYKMNIHPVQNEQGTRTKQAIPLYTESTTESTTNSKGKVPKTSDGKPAYEKIDHFVEFWDLYPRKVGKPAAEKSFKRLKPDKALLKKITSAIKSYMRTEGWQKDGGKYIPYPATFLNQERWEDELEVTAPRQRVILPSPDHD